MEAISSETDFLKNVNESLEKNQKIWQEQLQNNEKSKDEKIKELEVSVFSFIKFTNAGTSKRFNVLY